MTLHIITIICANVHRIQHAKSFMPSISVNVIASGMRCSKFPRKQQRNSHEITLTGYLAFTSILPRNRLLFEKRNSQLSNATLNNIKPNKNKLILVLCLFSMLLQKFNPINNISSSACQLKDVHGRP